MRLISVLCLALLLALAPRRALATSCAPPELESSLQEADVVFIGTAERVQSGPYSVAHFRVERVFKGELPAEVRVQGGGLAGAMFEPKQRFVVFADLTSDPQTPLNAHLCGGTSEVARAGDWVARLGEGRPAQGSAIVTGKTDAAAPAPAEPEPEPEPPFTPAPEPRLSEPPPETAPPASNGGCASCSIGAEPGAFAPWLAAALALALFARRRSAPSVR